MQSLSRLRECDDVEALLTVPVAECVAALKPVNAGRRPSIAAEKTIKFGDRALADQCNRSIECGPQACEQIQKSRFDLNRVRGRRYFQ